MEEERVGWGEGGSVGRLGVWEESVMGGLVHITTLYLNPLLVYCPLLQDTGGTRAPSVHDQGCGPGEPRPIPVCKVSGPSQERHRETGGDWAAGGSGVPLC